MLLSIISRRGLKLDSTSVTNAMLWLGVKGAVWCERPQICTVSIWLLYNRTTAMRFFGHFGHIVWWIVVFNDSPYDFVIPWCLWVLQSLYVHLTMFAWSPYDASAICTIVWTSYAVSTGAMWLVCKCRTTWSSKNFSHSPYSVWRYMTT